MKKIDIDSISLQALYLLIFFNFQAVLSKELLISEEFQKPQITEIDVNGWSQNIIRTCEQQNIVEYTGQIFGVFSQDVSNNQKTYSKLPPHWSALVRLDLLLYGSVDADEGDFAGISIDSNPMDKFTKNEKDGYKICSDSKSFIGTPHNDGIYPYQKNVTHTSNLLTIKIDSQFTGPNTPSNYEGYGFKHVSVYIDTCYETCYSCTGPSPNQCKSCIQNAELVDGVCTCSGLLFAYQFKCVNVCPDGFFGNIKTKICEQSKSLNNCQNFINQSCTLCITPYKLMNGECFLQCPSYSIDKGTYCEDNIIELINGDYIFKGLFSSNFGDSEIQGKGLKLNNFKNGGATFSSCSGERYVGGWKVAGSGSQILLELKNIKPYRKLRIGFKYIMIDNWDQNEFIQVINNFQIISNITHLSAGLVGNICGNKNPEVQGVYDYNYTDYSSSISIQIQNNLDSSKSPFEASFGIREMYILVHYCQEGCLECNETGCTKCSNTKYLFQHNCVDSCPQNKGYFANKQTNTCDQCQDNCLACESATQCKQCKQGYLFNQKCLSVCPIEYSPNQTTNECSKCHQNCTTCQYPNDENQCTSCKDNLLLSGSKCVQQCPDKTYQDKNEKKCQPCHSTCLKCYGNLQNQCQKCVDGYFFYKGQCLKQCPKNTYSMKIYK